MSDIAGVWTSLTVAGQRSLVAQQQRCFCLAMRDSPHQFPWSSPLMASAGCIPEQSQRLQEGNDLHPSQGRVGCASES
jgi:hypothetical protein